LGSKAINIKKIGKSALFSQVVTVILTAIFAIVVYFGNISESISNVILLGIIIFSVFFGGFVLSKNIEHSGLLNGLFLALVYIMLLVPLSIILNKTLMFGKDEITKIICILGAGMLGGIIGINT